jgi:hypothetical protein
LQVALVELVDLALLGKQLHRSVVARRFRPLDLQLRGAGRTLLGYGDRDRRVREE